MSTELATQDKTTQLFNPTSVTDLPNLAELEVCPISEVSEYWTPEDKGEAKLVFFDSLSQEMVLDEETGEERKLPSVVLYEQVKGQLCKISNSSKRLVGHFERSNYASGTPLKVTYQGKVKNKNNSYQSDSWDVRRLMPSK